MTDMGHMRALLALAAVTALLTVGPVAGRDAAPGSSSITAADLRRDVFFLASDEMGGRMVGTPENRLAARFLATRFEHLGLRPVGADESYLLPFELLETALGSDNRLAVRAANVTPDPELGRHFFPLRFSGSGSASGTLVFAGFGISAPHLNHDDFGQEMDVAGRVVLILEHEPGEHDPTSIFDGTTGTEHGRALHKALEAQRRGASAIMLAPDIHQHAADRAFPQQMEATWPPGSRRVPAYELGVWAAALKIPAIRISQELAEELISAAGHELADLARQSEQAGGITAMALNDVTVEITTAVDRKATVVPNVVGLIEGEDPDRRHEWIIVCAHFDHEGATATGIFPGADDDASGVAGLLEIADAFRHAAEAGERPARSVMIAAWNAEERGLLGAWAYVSQPLNALSDTVAVLNMDMIGRHEEIPANGGRRFRGLQPQTAHSNRNAVNVLGYSYSDDLRRAAETANAVTALDVRFRYDDNPSNLLRRSDHWPFLFSGVPALFIHTGLHPDYHTPADRPERLDLDKMTRVVRFVYQLTWDLAANPDRPILDD